MGWIRCTTELLRSWRFRLSSVFPGHVDIRVGTKADGVCLLSQTENASIAYLLEGHIAKREFGRVRRVDPALRSPGRVACSTVIVVRYLPKAWREPLRQFKNAGGKIIYFMDDDLMDRSAAYELPERYAKKILRFATSQRRTIEALCDEFWVSSEFLAQKYAGWSPDVLVARPAMDKLAKRVTTTVCYHGTASHTTELKWLVDVISRLQSTELTTRFEVFGNADVNRLFRDISRVAVLHPMSWPNYLEFTRSVTRDIALAPLLPQPFNAGRGPTKFFDFARMDAVGIYTDVEPYKSFVRDGVDGILLPNDPELWVKTIVELAADKPRRTRMAQAARERALEMAWDRIGERK